MTSLLINDLNDFTPSSTLCYNKEKVEPEVAIMMPTTPLQPLQVHSNISFSNLNMMMMMMMNLTIDEENWLLQTRGKYIKFVIHHFSTATEPRYTSNQKLVSFRKGIKREETAYPTLKDERYFDSFSRSLYITAKSHQCEEVLDPEDTPTNSEKELLEAKQVFMFSVLEKHLLTDMGKTIVRKYVHTTAAQSVWKDFNPGPNTKQSWMRMHWIQEHPIWAPERCDLCQLFLCIFVICMCENEMVHPPISAFWVSERPWVF